MNKSTFIKAYNVIQRYTDAYKSLEFGLKLDLGASEFAAAADAGIELLSELISETYADRISDCLFELIFDGEADDYIDGDYVKVYSPEEYWDEIAIYYLGE